MIKKLLEKYHNYMVNRTAYYHLMSMTERQLRDLGISRGEIRRLTGLGDNNMRKLFLAGAIVALTADVSTG